MLKITNLTKNFGKRQAVKNLNLNIAQGCVFGLLGPNGSGKTTTLGMILGVTNPTSGSYSWFGKGQGAEIRKSIGAILEQPVFYPYMTGEQNLNIVCKIKGLPKSAIAPALKQVGLVERKHDKFSSYSLGMKQRLAIASALLCDPKVLILDEPTNGLDPQGIAEIRQIIKAIADSGKTIILASHLLDEVQKVCTHFCVLKNGELIHQGEVEADFETGTCIELSCDDNAKLKHILENKPGINNSIEQGDIVLIKGDNSLCSQSINQYLMDQGLVLSQLNTINKTLEQRFLEILGEDNA